MLNCTERIRLKQEFDLAVVAALAFNPRLAKVGFPNDLFRTLIYDFVPKPVENTEDANRNGETARTAYSIHIRTHRCLENPNSSKEFAA